MDFSLNEDRRMLAETLERFLKENYPLDIRHAAAKSEAGYSPQMWAQFAELGVIGALFPENVGGFGGDGDDLMVVFEALGKALVVEPFLPVLMAGTILSGAADDESLALVAKAIAGETLLAVAHGEPQSRYELADVATKAVRDGDHWRLTGNKSVVLGGGQADWLVVSARTSGEQTDENGISLFTVDAKSAGVNVRAYSTVDGYGAAEISLDAATVRLIGEAGEGFAAIERSHAFAITAVCAECLGAMERAKDLTVEYMHTRKQFGVIIGKFQALQHRMADVLIEIEQLRSAVINAAGSLGADRHRREKAVSAAKNLAGRAGRQTAEEAIQIHGGMGMTWEYPVGHYAKRITMIEHLFGDADHHLERYIALG